MVLNKRQQSIFNSANTLSKCALNLGKVITKSNRVFIASNVGEEPLLYLLIHKSLKFNDKFLSHLFI